MQSALSGWVARPLFWIAIVGSLASFQIVRAVARELPPLPPVMATLPHFELTNQRGEPFGSDRLRGKVWIANFVFTRCPTVCPVFTERMAALRDRIKHAAPDMHLVSFSVDPEYDTPEVLRDYASRYQASEHLWTWLTGSWDEVRATVKEGMKIAMEYEGQSPESSEDVPDIIHGTHFVLVDRDLQIRGYYDSEDPAAIDRMLSDAGALLNRDE